MTRRREEEKANKPIRQVEYMGKLFPEEGFRTWVYGLEGKEKLADSYEEYKELVGSGLWYDRKSDVPAPQPKEVEEKPKKEASKPKQKKVNADDNANSERVST